MFVLDVSKKESNLPVLVHFSPVLRCGQAQKDHQKLILKNVLDQDVLSTY